MDINRKKRKFYRRRGKRQGINPLIGIQISKEWHKHPNWFDELTKKEQIQLLSLYIIENTKEEKNNKRENFHKKLIQRQKLLGLYDEKN